jgi:hypothetical protein
LNQLGRTGQDAVVFIHPRTIHPPGRGASPEPACPQAGRSKERLR